MAHSFRILMICTGNICRSPMAEGLLRRMLSESGQTDYAVSSAGTHALHGQPAEAPAVAVMASRGIDISAHRARRLNKRMLKAADLVLVMEEMHLRFVRRLLLFGHRHAYRLGRFDPDGVVNDIPDPIGGDEQAYVASAAMIAACLREVVGQIETYR